MSPAEFGQGTLFTAPDPEAARAQFRSKSRKLADKLTTVREAVHRLIKDGDYIAVGGFGSNRIPTAVLHEIVRQGRKGLGLSGHTATHDFQILAAGDCLDRCDVAYVVGLEARGLSRIARRAFESGRVQAVEWTNAALAWRYRAAAMGIPFIPARVMLGTDTGTRSAAKLIACPFTGLPLAALPALYPDVGMIHVHRADIHGNCQIDGIEVSDRDMARAARRLIITCERLVPAEEIRREPHRTVIPHFCVDAVCEVPYGSYPGNMAGEYFSDEEHLREWLEAQADDAAFSAFLDRYLYGPEDFQAYVALIGQERLLKLRRLELLIRTGGEPRGV